MYLPTFWKLTTEAYGYKMRHVAGWGLPATLFSKSILSIKSTAVDILDRRFNSQQVKEVCLTFLRNANAILIGL